MPASHAHTTKEHHQPKSHSKHAPVTHEKPDHKSAIAKEPVTTSNSPQQNQPDKNSASFSQDTTDKDKVKPIDGQAMGAKDEAASTSRNPSQANEKDNKLRNSIIAVLFVIAFAAIGYGDYEHVKYVAAAKDDTLRAAAGNSATANTTAKTTTNPTDGTPSQFMR